MIGTYHNLDASDPVQKEVLDLIEKGLAEYGFDENGEMILCLTEQGLAVAEEIGDE